MSARAARRPPAPRAAAPDPLPRLSGRYSPQNLSEAAGKVTSSIQKPSAPIETEGVELFIQGGAGGGLENVTCPLPEGLPSPWTSVQAHHSLTVETGCDALTIVATDIEGNELDRVSVPYAGGAGSEAPQGPQP